MSATQQSSGSEALQYVSQPRFHREFTLPATAEHDALTVSFADLGRAPEPESNGTATAPPPTVLFMPGMFASRYHGVAMHAVADKLGVRVVVVDRPGMGKSTDVPLQQRVSIWVELVPRLLDHLRIQHVALMSHSAGTVFLFNTLCHCRDILHPERPFVALLAPWVDPSHSKIMPMQMAQYVPSSAFSIWNLIPQFFVLQAGPAFASSGAVVGKASNMMSGVSGISTHRAESEVERSQKEIERHYGMSQELQIEIGKQIVKSMFEENTVGANSEALQCLRKSNSSWGTCSDYAQFVRDLASRERRRSSSEGTRTPLKVSAYFAETDHMVGKKGQVYMEQCWNGNEGGEFRDVFSFESRTVAGTDHDTVVQSVDVMAKVFMDAGGVALGAS